MWSMFHFFESYSHRLHSRVAHGLCLLGFVILAFSLHMAAAHAEIVCDVGQGHLKFGAISEHSPEVAVGEVSISCRNLSNVPEGARVTVYLSSANNYRLGNQRNERSMAIRVYADDTFRVPLGTFGTDAVLLARVLQLDGGSSEEMVVPIFAALEVGDRPSVGDYKGTLSIELKLDPVGVGQAGE